MTKNWKIRFRYKPKMGDKWVYDYASTQAKSQAEAKERIMIRIRRELTPWEVEL